MIRRFLLRALGADVDALARVAHLTERVYELEVNKAALTMQADAQEHRADEADRVAGEAQEGWAVAVARADEAERLLDREQMINKQLTARAARPSWLVPRDPDSDTGPESISPTTDAAYRAQIASLRRDLAAADQRSEEWRVAHDRLSTYGIEAGRRTGTLAPLETRIEWLFEQRKEAERGWSQASHELSLSSKGAASCACSADGGRRSNADEVLR